MTKKLIFTFFKTFQSLYFLTFTWLMELNQYFYLYQGICNFNLNTEYESAAPFGIYNVADKRRKHQMERRADEMKEPAEDIQPQ